MSFEAFHWPFAMKKVDVVPGHTDQTTGAWVAEQTTETVISGHVSDVTLNELQYIDPGIVEAGVRKLACARSAGLALGDRIKITEPDSSVSEWLIESKLYHPGLIEKHTGIARETFLLKRR